MNENNSNSSLTAPITAMDLTDSSNSSFSHHQHSAYELILDHLFRYPGTYTMPGSVAGDTKHDRPSLPDAWALPSGYTNNATTPTDPTPLLQLVNAQVSTKMMNRLQDMQSSPRPLPPSFIAGFLRGCFVPKLSRVDFPQALTGLEYLDVLYSRQKREVAEAKKRLRVLDVDFTNHDEIQSLPHAVVKWVEDIHEAQRKAESSYTQVYVAIRKWILLNEMSLQPFNREIASKMLDELFPINTATQPTSHLTPAVLANQRAVFESYFDAVTRKGVDALKPLLAHGRRSSDPPSATGWAAVVDTLESHLRVALYIIDEASAITTREDMQIPSLTASGRPITHSTKAASALESTSASPVVGNNKPSITHKLSRLERIAIEVRRLTGRNTDLDTTQMNTRQRKPRPIKSMTNLKQKQRTRIIRANSQELVPEDAHAEESFNLERVRAGRVLKDSPGMVASLT